MPRETRPPLPLPAFVSAYSIAIDADDAAAPELLFPSVHLPEALRRAASRRQIEFLAGRYCAQRAVLGALSIDPGTLPVGEGGAPRWPHGVVGSITHSRRLASAAVARRSDAAAIGIDSEAIMAAAQADEVRPLIVQPGELALAVGGGRGEREALTLLFSAKESVYKGLYASVGRYFDYLDVVVTLDPAGEFEARLEVDLAPALPAGARFRGRYAIDDAHVHTALVLPAAGRAAVRVLPR